MAELLLDQPKLGEGRGRGKTDSGVNVERLFPLVEADTLEEFVEAIISRGSPFLALDKGTDWYGTKSGAIADLTAMLEEENIEAKISRRTKGENANRLQISFSRSADEVVEEVVDDDENAENAA